MAETGFGEGEGGRGRVRARGQLIICQEGRRGLARERGEGGWRERERFFFLLIGGRRGKRGG